MKSWTQIGPDSPCAFAVFLQASITSHTWSLSLTLDQAGWELLPLDSFWATQPNLPSVGTSSLVNLPVSSPLWACNSCIRLALCFLVCVCMCVCVCVWGGGYSKNFPWKTIQTTTKTSRSKAAHIHVRTTKVDFKFYHRTPWHNHFLPPHIHVYIYCRVPIAAYSTHAQTEMWQTNTFNADCGQDTWYMCLLFHPNLAQFNDEN